MCHFIRTHVLPYGADTYGILLAGQRPQALEMQAGVARTRADGLYRSCRVYGRDAVADTRRPCSSPARLVAILPVPAFFGRPCILIRARFSQHDVCVWEAEAASCNVSVLRRAGHSVASPRTDADAPLCVTVSVTVMVSPRLSTVSGIESGTSSGASFPKRAE